jgi:hypothetical protein
VTSDMHPELVAAVKAANDWLKEYEDSYEFYGEDKDGREGTYTPNEREAMLISDALAGIMDEEFVTLMGEWYIARQKQRVADGDCPGCGAPNGQHWGRRPGCTPSAGEKP